MLVQFKVKNFRSFRDEQSLLMTADSISELRTNTFASEAMGDVALLKSVVIYGPNASGKSNLIRAVKLMRSVIVDFRGLHQIAGDSAFQPYRLDKKTSKQPVEFEISFILDEVRYQYGFALAGGYFKREWLYAYPNKLAQRWFERVANAPYEDTWEFGSNLKGEKKKLTALCRPDVLFLTVAAQFNQQQLTPVFEWFEKGLQVIDVSTTGPLGSSLDYTAKKAAEDPKFHAIVLDALKAADLGINDFHVELPTEDPDQQNLFDSAAHLRVSRTFRRKPMIVKTRHPIAGSDDHAEFDLRTDESLGTRRFFALIGHWVKALQTASIVFSDELDASLHPMLTRFLVAMFNDPQSNRRQAQAVFTTHDTTLLDNTLFRRDQIWFTEKDRDGASHLYSLQDFQPRKGEAFQKGYLVGRYGAIPFVGEPRFL